jgi:hypothetical protein
MDLQPIKSLIENRGQPWSLTFYPRKNDPRSDRLEAFLQELNREAGIAWTVTNPPDAENLDLPAFSLGNAPQSRDRRDRPGGAGRGGEGLTTAGVNTKMKTNIQHRIAVITIFMLRRCAYRCG